MSDLYHGEYPVDLTPNEARALCERMESQAKATEDAQRRIMNTMTTPQEQIISDERAFAERLRALAEEAAKVTVPIDSPNYTAEKWFIARDAALHALSPPPAQAEASTLPGAWIEMAARAAYDAIFTLALSDPKSGGGVSPPQYSEAVLAAIRALPISTLPGEVFVWMLRHKETGAPFWNEDSCVWDNRQDAEESAEFNSDYEAIALYASPPTTPAVKSGEGCPHDTTSTAVTGDGYFSVTICTRCGENLGSPALPALRASEQDVERGESGALEELNKIAEQVGEAGDPFAAWEAIDAIIRQRDIYHQAVQDVIRCPSGNRAVAIAHEANARARPDTRAGE